MTDFILYIDNIIEYCISTMKNPYLGFNYFLFYCSFAMLLLMLAYASATKILQDFRKRRYKELWMQFYGEIKSLFFSTDSAQVDLPFLQRLDEYFGRNHILLKKGIKRVAFENALLLIISEREDAISMGRQTAYQFSLVEASAAALRSRSVSRQLRGCQQAGAYLYEPSIPLLLNLLRKQSSRLQYSVLLALADFRRPELIVDSFKIIENNIMANERIFRQVVSKMGDRKTELFGAIFELNSPILTPNFLNYIDTYSANVYFDQIIVMGKSEDIELRIAAIRGIAASKNSRGTPELIDAIRAEEWEVRAAAAKGMQSISSPEADSQLLCAICDRSWWVRYNAAKAVLMSPNHKELVEKVLQSEDLFAIDSLHYSAYTIGMMDIVALIQDQTVEEGVSEPFDTDNLAYSANASN